MEIKSIIRPTTTSIIIANIFTSSECQMPQIIHKCNKYVTLQNMSLSTQTWPIDILVCPDSRILHKNVHCFWGAISPPLLPLLNPNSSYCPVFYRST